MKYKIKILCILPSLHAGGAENYLLRLIRFAGTNEFEWHVLSPNLSKGDLHEVFEEAGAYICYKSIGYINPLKFLSFYKYLRSNKFDSICSLNGVFGGFSLAIAKAAGVKVRVGWHRRSTPAFNPTFFRNIYSKLALMLLENSSTRILSNSCSALDYFHGVSWVGDKKFSNVPNGLDPYNFVSCKETKEEACAVLGIPKNSFVVGHVGRYDPAKNHYTIFQVAEILIKRIPNVKFVFCGRDTNSEKFKQQLDHFNISSHCIILGLQDNLALVYRSFDVFYFPSVTEGQPNALIEAMLAKVPIVTSDIPAIREALPSMMYPKLLPPMDSIQAAEILNAHQYPSAIESSFLFEWAKDRYDLKKNMSLSLKFLLND